MEAEPIYFHQVLGHPSKNHLRAAIQIRYHHYDLRRSCSNFSYNACQRYKLDGKGCGLLPERDMIAMPFNKVEVDLVGPWKIDLHGKVYKFNALVSIDLVQVFKHFEVLCVL